MGEGEQRRTKRTARYDSRELAHLVRKHTRTEADWDRDFANGTQPLSTVDSRTQTVDDPLTTSLLAEITRRAMTLDLPAAEPVEPGEPVESTDHEPIAESPDSPDLVADPPV
jgi:hypothetical protein